MAFGLRFTKEKNVNHCQQLQQKKKIFIFKYGKNKENKNCIANKNKR